jgi:formate--tetrahydrofolate ligase
MAPHEVPVLVARHWAEGGKGAEDVARAVVRLVEDGASAAKGFSFVYPDEAPLLDKIGAIATKVYDPGGVSGSACSKRRVMATPRCAWPRRSTRFPPTPAHVAPPAATP